MRKIIDSILIVAILSLGMHSVYATNIPDYYAEPGFKSEREYENQQEVEFIDPFSGGLHLQYADLVVPGNAGLDIVVRRTYRSPSGEPGILGSNYLDGHTVLGLGWDMHFGRVWYGDSFFSDTGCGSGNVSSKDNPVLELSDGTRKVLIDADSTQYGYITKDDWIGKCITGGGLEVISPDGVKYFFDFYYNYANKMAWHVTKIEDRWGNTLNITYHPFGDTYHALIKEISSNDGRSVTFHYDDTRSYEVLLNEVRLNGVTKYRYNHEVIADNWNPKRYFLSQVTRSERGNWDYTYYNAGDLPSSDLAGLYGLRSMTNPFGVQTTYSYDVVYFSSSLFLGTTVVASKSTYGGGIQNTGTWTYSYVPGQFDVTTMRSPNYCTTYKHKGAQVVPSGSVWKIGTLIEKKYYDSVYCSTLLQTETYDWTTKKVSDQNEYHRRENAVDIFTYQPIVSKKTISRDGNTYVTTYTGHDVYGNPGRKTENGPSNTSRITDYTYQNFINISSSVWILGQVDRENISSVGIIDNDYFTSGVRLGSLMEINKFGVISQYDYHTSGSDLGGVKSVKDPELNTTLLSSYKRGVPQTVNHPEGIIIRRVVNTDGTIESETDGRSKTTSYTYDGLKRIRSITTPKSTDSNVTVVWDYFTNGRKRTTNRGIYTSVQTSDGFGRVIDVQTEGVNKHFEYNEDGQLTFESYLYGTTGSNLGDTYVRDVLGRIKRITHADGSYIRYEYLSQNKVRVTDEELNQTTYTYRSYGNPDERQLVSIASPESITTVIERDKIGNITGVTQGTKTRTYTLDTRKYLDSILHPEIALEDVNYDDAGNMISRKVGASATTLYVYDGMNRLDFINYPTGTNDIDFIYNGDNSVKTVNNTISNWDYIYDDNGNLDSEKLTVQSNIYELVYNYDDRDNLKSITYPNGLVIDYSPDDLGRASKVSDFVTNINYHPNFQIEDIYFQNGKRTSIGLDNRQFPDTLATTGVANLKYLYDDIGNATSITDTLNTSTNRTLTYDGVNRLKTASGSWGSGTITYLPEGNIKTKNIGGFNLTYNYGSTNNQLNSISGSKVYNFGYDVYGNVISNGTDSFIYNDASQLVQVAGKNLTYQYDGNGNRVIKSRNGQIDTILLYNNAGQLMYESDQYDDYQSVYVYLGSMLVAKQDYCSDQDNDLDGLLSCLEIKMGLSTGTNDTDGDGILDSDEDHDSDGISNIYEVNNGLDPFTNDASTDLDNDGLSNLQEFTLGTSANNPDSDSDNMNDGWEHQYGLAILSNDASLDADADQLTNLQEYTIGTNPTLKDTDNDGINDPDDDQDTDLMPNLFELQNGLNPIVNDAALDKDSDGLTNYTEYALGSNVSSPDTDSDGMPDGWEHTYSLNLLLNDAAVDTDLDTLLNIDEYKSNTDPGIQDSDGDGISDADEDADTDGLSNLAEAQNSTNPLDPDTDNDGMTDGYEVQYQLNPLVADANQDPDLDQLTNIEEFLISTNPNNPDTDGDTLADGLEITLNTNPLVDDRSVDSDADGLSNVREYQLGLNLFNADTDDDLMKDGYEVTYGLDPKANDADLDPDLDGLTNLTESQYGTNPNKADTDGDGVNDGDEVLAGTDPLFNLAAFIPIINLILF